MYGIVIQKNYIYHKHQLNAGKSTIHRSYRYGINLIWHHDQKKMYGTSRSAFSNQFVETRMQLAYYVGISRRATRYVINHQLFPRNIRVFQTNNQLNLYDPICLLCFKDLSPSSQHDVTKFTNTWKTSQPWRFSRQPPQGTTRCFVQRDHSSQPCVARCWATQGLGFPFRVDDPSRWLSNQA